MKLLKRLLSTALILILISVPVYADDFKDAEEALNRKDYSTAFNKFKPLAERGDTSSQFNIGLMYQLGVGVGLDTREAIKWFLPLAKEGHKKAQFALGEIFLAGKDVKRDYVEAHKWFNLSGVNKHEKGYEKRDFLEKKMSGEEISKAKLMAQEWLWVDARFSYITADINLDGKFTISDVTLWLGWYFFYPGDWLIEYSISKFEPFAIFFEISTEFYGGWWSGVITFVSLIVFFLGLGAIAIFVESVGDYFDRNRSNVAAETWFLIFLTVIIIVNWIANFPSELKNSTRGMIIGPPIFLCLLWSGFYFYRNNKLNMPGVAVWLGRKIGGWKRRKK